MPTRIDIELTSITPDGSWTWRAAGAREPKGVLDAAILPDGAAVGDQLRAETEHDVDGIHVTSVFNPKGRTERTGLLELIVNDNFEPVTQQRATRDRGDRRDGGRRDRRGRDGERRGRDGRDGRDGDRRGPRRDGDGAHGRGDGDRDARRPERRGPRFTPPPELPTRPKPKRLRPGNKRRQEVLAGLPEEQRPVAELALQGMQAVRQRVRADNEKLVADGKPAMPEATVMKMAEDLLPRMRVADWLDRAEAAQRQLEHLDLRDLRSVVAAADDPSVARDESTRALAAELKDALVRKQEEELNLWLADVEAAVDVGRIVRALRLSAMPPKAGVPFPGALGAKLGEATTAALGAEDPAERWSAVLEAAAFSPVRALVTPTVKPNEVNDELTKTVTRLGPLLPQVAALFGIEVPADAPAPKPLRPTPRKTPQASGPQGGGAPGRGDGRRREGGRDDRDRSPGRRGDRPPAAAPAAEVAPAADVAPAAEPAVETPVTATESLATAADDTAAAVDTADETAAAVDAAADPVADAEAAAAEPVADTEAAAAEPVADAETAADSAVAAEGAAAADGAAAPADEQTDS